ncbi:MAG: hypothetical protein L6Q78_11210 [Bacteroidia bacterium]|nr:hypothetical protein [Bacteroidia bacterium]
MFLFSDFNYSCKKPSKIVEEQGKKNEIGQLKLKWGDQLIGLNAHYEAIEPELGAEIAVIKQAEALVLGEKRIILLACEDANHYPAFIARAEGLEIAYALPGQSLLPGLKYQKGFYYSERPASSDSRIAEKREALLDNLQALLALVQEREKLLVDMGRLKAENGLEAWQADAFLRAWAQLKQLGNTLGLDPNFCESLYLLLHEHALHIQKKQLD